jgi:acyl-CoA dehydrogenase
MTQEAEIREYTESLSAWLRDNSVQLDPWRHRAPGSLAEVVEHDRELLRLLFDAGWSRAGWPEAAGGTGGPIALRAVLYDELAAAGIEVPEAFVIVETLGPLLTELAPALAVEHLPRYLRGEQMWGQGFSEPGAGSDLASLRTKAERVDGGFRISGEKIWTTLGQFAQYAAVLVRTDAADKPHRGLTMLWVDLEQDAATVRPIAAASGRDEFAEMHFDAAFVPDAYVIGEVGGGWAAAMYLLQFERGMYAWLRQAILHRRLREIAAGAPADADETALAALGRAQRICAGLRARSRRTVLRLSQGENPGPEISVDKILLGQSEQAVFDAWRQIDPDAFAFGDDSVSAVLREEWFYSRAATIFGGAADIQRDIVADRVLELPRGSR